MNNLDRIRIALEKLLGKPVESIDRVEWDAKNHPDGAAVRLKEPLKPYRGILRNPNFDQAVASGVAGTQAGFHHVRHDQKDHPNVVNIDSHDAILDLHLDPRWPEVLRIARLERTPDLDALAGAHVFGFQVWRPDHHSTEVPGWDPLESTCRHASLSIL